MVNRGEEGWDVGGVWGSSWPLPWAASVISRVWGLRRERENAGGVIIHDSETGWRWIQQQPGPDCATWWLGCEQLGGESPFQPGTASWRTPAAEAGLHLTNKL